MKLSTFHRVALVGAVLAVGLAACGSNDKDSSSSTPAAGGGDFTNGGLTIAMITHEVPGDTYWDIVKAGANEAAKAHNITLKYSSDPDFTKQAVLVQNAIDSGVDGIALTAAGPSALRDVVKAANAAKIPVVMFDSGIDDWKALGAIMYFGSDEYLGGVALGDRIGAAGGKHILCVIHQEGNVALEARCKGVKESKGGATSENMQVNGSDDGSVNASITAKLQQDPSIDWIVTMGAPVALLSMESIKTAGTSTQVATFDLNVAAAKAIKDGTLAMAVDAQPYAQGYEAVDSLWLYNTNGNDLGGGQSVLTGPSIVDSSNIDKVLPFAEGGTR